jgi:hypothetical protein
MPDSTGEWLPQILRCAEMIENDSPAFSFPELKEHVFGELASDEYRWKMRRDFASIRS